MPIPRKEEQIAYYEELLRKYGEGVEALDWKGQKSQQDRFRMLVQVLHYTVPIRHPSILDLGSGFGDLFEFLSNQKDLLPHGFDYRGYDISPRFVQIARERYPAAQFEVVDILERAPKQTFDLVICSGALNICIGDRSEHDRYVVQMLEAMYRLAHRAVSVNFLSEWYLDRFKDLSWHSDRYAHYSPETILSGVRTLTTRVVLRHDYAPSDFTVYLLKEDVRV